MIHAVITELFVFLIIELEDPNITLPEASPTIELPTPAEPTIQHLNPAILQSADPSATLLVPVTVEPEHVNTDAYVPFTTELLLDMTLELLPPTVDRLDAIIELRMAPAVQLMLDITEHPVPRELEVVDPREMLL